jgi:hypothetical protein
MNHVSEASSASLNRIGHASFPYLVLGQALAKRTAHVGTGLDFDEASFPESATCLGPRKARATALEGLGKSEKL